MQSTEQALASRQEGWIERWICCLGTDSPRFWSGLATTRVANRPRRTVRHGRRALWLVAGLVLAVALALTAVFASGSPPRPQQTQPAPLPASPADQARELSRCGSARTPA